eukprot:6475500-Amphidinium_carterae.1
MEQHGPLEPDPVWLAWQDFAMKVCNFWRLVGPQLRDKPEEQLRVKLPTEPPAPPPAAPVRVPDTDAPFQLGDRHWSGRLGVTAGRSRPRSTRRGPLVSLRRHKLPVRAAQPPVGEATGGPSFLAANEVRSGNRPTLAVESRNRLPAGGTTLPEAAQALPRSRNPHFSHI